MYNFLDWVLKQYTHTHHCISILFAEKYAFAMVNLSISFLVKSVFSLSISFGAGQNLKNCSAHGQPLLSAFVDCIKSIYLSLSEILGTLFSWKYRGGKTTFSRTLFKNTNQKRHGQVNYLGSWFFCSSRGCVNAASNESFLLINLKRGFFFYCSFVLFFYFVGLVRKRSSVFADHKIWREWL